MNKQVHISCKFCWDVEVRAGFRCDPHAHPCTEIVFSESAEGLLFQDQRTYSYFNNSVFVYQPSGEHWIENKVSGRQLCIGVWVEPVYRIRAGVYRVNQAIVSRLLEMRQVFASDLPDKGTRMDLLSGLLVMDILSLDKEQPWTKPLDRIEQVKLHIDKHYATELTVKSLAASACVSGDYLRQLFRDRYGISIKSYIISKRIDRACELLATTDHPVNEIAASVGIPNEFYFSRLFKKYRQMTPTEFRGLKKVNNKQLEDYSD